MVMPMDVEAIPLGSVQALGEAWRALEAAAEPCFFRSWSWVGCLFEERFDDPVVLRARHAGRVVGLAVFNRSRGRLVLGASGDSRRDAPHVEHNGPLVAADAPAGTAAALLRAAWRQRGVRRLLLPGVPPALVEVAGGAALRLQVQPAPCVRLDAVREAGGEHLAVLGANTRWQIRRSLRRYATRGEVRLDCAATEREALDWLESLVALHQRDWQRRGAPGAFADPFMLRFHQALIARAMPRGEVELLRLAVGGQALGYLYNFRLGGRVLAYQSGLDRDDGGPQDKPGLVAHHLAIQRAVAAGDEVYDFLAGAARYKSSLANAEQSLAWAEMVPRASPLRLAAALLRGWRRLAR